MPSHWSCEQHQKVYAYMRFIQHTLCTAASTVPYDMFSHLESLQDEGPASLPELLHDSPGAGCALPEGAAHQALLGKASAQLAPAAWHML